jgi:hypothetical protein
MNNNSFYTLHDKQAPLSYTSYNSSSMVINANSNTLNRGRSFSPSSTFYGSGRAHSRSLDDVSAVSRMTGDGNNDGGYDFSGSGSRPSPRTKPSGPFGSRLQISTEGGVLGLDSVGLGSGSRDGRDREGRESRDRRDSRDSYDSCDAYSPHKEDTPSAEEKADPETEAEDMYNRLARGVSQQSMRAVQLNMKPVSNSMHLGQKVN